MAVVAGPIASVKDSRCWSCSWRGAMRSSITDSEMKSVYVRSVVCVSFSSMAFAKRGCLALSRCGAKRRLVFQRVGDLHVDVHRLVRHAVERTGRRGGVAVVAAVCDADVVGLRQHAVRRVEPLPADVRDVELHPGVT